MSQRRRCVSRARAIRAWRGVRLGASRGRASRSTPFQESRGVDFFWREIRAMRVSYFFHIYRNSRLKGMHDFLNVHRGGRETKPKSTWLKNDRMLFHTTQSTFDEEARERRRLLSRKGVVVSSIDSTYALVTAKTA